MTATIIAELGLSALPSPLELSNGQVIKEPFMLLAYCEKEAVKESDLTEIHGEESALIRGVRRNLLKVYSTPTHPWVIKGEGGVVD